MLRRLLRFFTESVGLKIVALILALILWFYVGKELSRESEGNRSFLKRLFPSEGVMAKKLVISPAIEGSPRSGYEVDKASVTLAPSYCIAVGTKDLLDNITIAPTMPINVDGASKSFVRSIPLRPIPGVYMEETATQVSIPIQRINKNSQ